MTRENPAMTFFPLKRQMLNGIRVNDNECREMLAEAQRLHAENQTLRYSATLATARHCFEIADLMREREK